MRWTSVLVSMVVLLAIVGWMATGNVGKEAVQAAQKADEAKRQQENKASVEPFLVQVTESTAQPYQRFLRTNGRTRAVRRSEIKVELVARVDQIFAVEGQLVESGQPIVSLSVDNRRAAFDAAQAAFERSRKNFAAVENLSRRGFQSEIEYLSAQENLAQAENTLVQARKALKDVNVNSPYQGIVQQLHIETGDLVSKEQAVATLVDLDPLEVVTFVSEQELAQIALNQQARVNLINDTEFVGQVSYISPSSDIDTGTFEVRVSMPNPGMRLAEGLSGIVSINIDTVPAHFQSKSVLTLNDQGVIGVKGVNSDNQVVFYPVTILNDTQDGVFLTDLPERVHLIVAGQDYVLTDSLVRLVEE